MKGVVVFSGSAHTALADEIWNHRHDVQNDYLSVEAAAALCRDYVKTTGPIVVADYADGSDSVKGRFQAEFCEGGQGY